MVFQLGALGTVPVGLRLDLVAARTAQAVTTLGLGDHVGVVEIDPALSDTAATQQAYGLPSDALANCVVVAGKRDGGERVGACVVLATTRADINTAVRRLLDVRKASFLAIERVVEDTEMEHGAITPIGLPPNWPIFVDRAVLDHPLVVIGSGVRKSKLLVPGSLLATLPSAQVVDGLGR